MDMKITQKKIPWKSYLEGFSKYKYIALVVLIGLVLLFWPTESGTQTEMQKQQTQHTEVVGGQLEQKLEKILSQIDGVGDCSVMLTTAAGPETIYQMNTSRQTSSDGQTEEMSTALISQGSSSEEPLVVQQRNPVYQGALIVCSGADSASVRLAVVDAVADLTGLGADQISVIKMK